MLKTQKKRNSLLSLAVCLLMLASLIIPANTQEASAAAATNLQNPRIEEDKSVTWDCITFGHYPQGEYIPQKKPKLPKENEIYRDADDTCFVYVKNPENNMSHYYKVEPIKWRVLSINGDEAMLLSDKNIDGGKAYNESDANVTWETCTIRSWLNGYNGTSNRDGISYTSVNFIDKAFSEKEQSAIKEKKIVTADNLYYDTDGGADTLDKICLPSIEEVMNPLFGFPSDPELETRIRESINTEYAASQYWMDNGTPDWWRLRSPGERASNVAYVRESGDVYADGDFVYHYGGFAVRPILYLDLNSELWSYVETVNSSDTQPWEEEPETIEKASQTIAAVSVIKVYGNKPFNLNAKAKGKLTYKSSDTKVAAVSAAGIVTIKGPGKATITITAAATSKYKAATKKITITVNPKKAALTKVSSPKAGTLKASWKKDTKASGYQVVIAQNSKFTKGKKTAAITKTSATNKTFSKLKKKATYYIKVRAYKTAGKTKLYGAYSSVKKVKIK